MRWRFKSVLRVGLLLIWIPVASLLMLEAALRLWGYADSNIYDPIYTVFTESEEIPYIHRAGLRQARGRGSVVFDSDELGLRSLSRPIDHRGRGEDGIHLALIGDSITFGEGVTRTEDTYCQIAEDTLNDLAGRDRFRIHNFGVSAYSVREMAATARERVPAVDPDLVIMALIPDDFNLERTPEVDRYGYHFNRQLSGFMARDSLLKRILRKVYVAYFLRNTLNRFRYGHEPASGDDPSTRDRSLPESFFYVRSFCAEMERQDRLYLILLLPSHANTACAPIVEALEQEAIPHLDLRWIYDEFSPEEYTAGRFDRHPAACVHHAIGEVLAVHLAD